MQTDQELKEKMAKQARFGLSDETCRQVQELIHQVAKEKIDAALAEMKRDLGFEASKMDVLAHQMLQIHRMHSIGDSMARRLKEDDLPASFYNAYRHVVKDTSTMLSNLDEQRIKENRKTFVSPEDAKAKLDEEQRWNHVSYAHSDFQYQKGYYYDTRHGMLQPAIDLPAEQVIERDIIRMRFLPKSPREDAIIADALLEIEKEEAEEDAWYEKVNNIEVPTSIRQFDPKTENSIGYCHLKHKSYASTAKKIFLERLQHYNETWQKAEEKVDGLMEAIGIKLGFRHESVGLPKCVQKAAEGDAEAIKELKSAVAEMQANASKKKTDAEKKEQLEHAFMTPFKVQALAIFLAFSSVWTCASMVFAVGHVCNVSSGMQRQDIASRWYDTIVPHKTVGHVSNVSTIRGSGSTDFDEMCSCKANLPLTPEVLANQQGAAALYRRATTSDCIPLTHCHEFRCDFSKYFSRGPALGLKSQGLNEAFFQCFSSVSTDTG